jgi:hypothetical protein
MKTILFSLAALCLLAGCSNQVRYRTAGAWYFNDEGKPAFYYQTYLEGSCSNGFAGMGRGCSNTNSHLKRCTLNADNTLACVDDAAAEKMLNKDLDQ